MSKLILLTKLLSFQYGRYYSTFEFFLDVARKLLLPAGNKTKTALIMNKKFEFLKSVEEVIMQFLNLNLLQEYRKIMQRKNIRIASR